MYILEYIMAKSVDYWTITLNKSKYEWLICFDRKSGCFIWRDIGSLTFKQRGVDILSECAEYKISEGQS